MTVISNVLSVSVRRANMIEHVLCAKLSSQHVPCIFSFKTHHHCSSITGEEAEARGVWWCPQGLCGWWVWLPGLGSCMSTSQVWHWRHLPAGRSLNILSFELPNKQQCSAPQRKTCQAVSFPDMVLVQPQPCHLTDSNKSWLHPCKNSKACFIFVWNTAKHWITPERTLDCSLLQHEFH